MVLPKQAEKPFSKVDLLSLFAVAAACLVLVYLYVFHFLEIFCVILQIRETSSLTSSNYKIHIIIWSSFSLLAISSIHHKYTDRKLHASYPLRTTHETGWVLDYLPVITLRV